MKQLYVVGSGPGYAPTDIQVAYNLPSDSSAAGSGATVAVVIPYDDPNLESDLATYRSTYGFPVCTTANGCFRKVNSTGGTTYPAANAGSAVEASIDTQMISLACPACRLLVVEAPSNLLSDLGPAVQQAVNLGAKVVSNSYGTAEYAGETVYDRYYNQLSAGVTVIASAGDTPHQTQYPAASSGVLAVGATSLTTTNNARGWSESVWSSTASGCSPYEAKPSWQTDTLCPGRTVADISAVGDPATGVRVYVTYPPSTGWGTYGGTSTAAPIVAGAYGRSNNQAVFSAGAKALYDTAYKFPGSVTDITQGKAGTCGSSGLCAATLGYDGPSGLGVLNGLPPDPAVAALSGPQGTVMLGAANSALASPPPICPCDPVNTATGNLFETATDMLVPGRGRNLTVTRTYNALAAASQGVVGPLGYGWTFSYAANAGIDGATGNVTIHEGNGSSVAFTKSGGTFNAPPWVLAKLTKNGDGSYTLTFPDQTSDTFNPSGQLVSQSDRNGFITSVTNAGNAVAYVQDPAGRRMWFQYISFSGYPLLSQVTDPTGNLKVAYTYYTNGDLKSVTDPTGNQTTFAYDSLHRLTSIKRPNSGITSNTYDASNRLTQQTDALGKTTSFSYAPGQTTGQTTVTDPNSNVTIYRYQNNVLTSETRGYPLNATWNYAYDESYERVQTTDPNGHSHHTIGDGRGNTLTSIDSLGRVTSYAFDSLSDLVSKTDPLGNVTTYSYDPHGNLTRVVQPMSVTTSFSYNNLAEPGDVTSEIDPNGQTWTFLRDTSGNLTDVIDPLGNRASATYNLDGWRTSLIRPNGNVSGGNPAAYTYFISYDNSGRPVQIVDPLQHNTQFVYDGDHNLVKLTDADGHVTNYAYDLADRLTVATRADLSTMRNIYDSGGNLTSQIDSIGAATTYGYDMLNRVTSVVDPLFRSTNYLYDLAGNLVSIKDAAGTTTTATFDAANELTAVSYSDGKTPGASFAYDFDGHRTAMTDGSGTTNYYYDSRGRLTDTINGASLWVSYKYDPKSQVTEIDYPYAGAVVKRTYDRDGRVVSVSDWAPNTTKFAYDADGNLTAETIPNGITNTFAYDRADRMTSVTDLLAGTNILSFTYTRDSVGLVKTVSASGAIQGGEADTYNSLNQLTAVGSKSYAYDAADRLTVMVSGLALSYDSANELMNTSQGSATTKFAYDARGNRLSASGAMNASYTYDAANRLISFGSTAYAYDGDGLRAKKSNGTTTSNFSWDVIEGTPHVLTDSTNIYLYGPGGQVMEEISPNGTPYWYHPDQQGSVRALSGPTGSYQGGYAYGDYGESTVTSVPNTIVNPFQYDGQYVDSESGLTYLRARYYDSSTGQFISRDPINPISRQPYTFAAGSPLNLADPTGLDPQLAASQPVPQGNGTGPGDCRACDLIQQLGGLIEPPNGGGGSPCGDPTIEPNGAAAAEQLSPEASAVKGGGESEAAANGRSIHAEFDKGVRELSQTDSRFQPGLRAGPHRPDAFFEGQPVELKPNTPSGLSAGRAQLRRYMGAFGADRGYLLTYDGSGNVFVAEVLAP